MSMMMSPLLAEDRVLLEDPPPRTTLPSWVDLAAGELTDIPAAYVEAWPVERDDLDRETLASDSWILVVDDEPMILATVRDILELDGYPVRTADNGKAALDLLAPDPPGLVVLDMRMPVMDGWEFARSLRARGLPIPILVMTAAQNARAWAGEIGAAGWLAKPFELHDLLKSVERLYPRDGKDPLPA